MYGPIQKVKFLAWNLKTLTNVLNKGHQFVKVKPGRSPNTTEYTYTDLAEMSRLKSVYKLSFAGPLISHHRHSDLSHLSAERLQIH